MLRFILYANISILFIFHTKSARFLSTYLFQTGSIFIIILRSQVTKLLNTLTKRGFVQRKMCQEDKRNNFVVLTEKGIEAKKVLTNIEEQVHADLTFTIAPQEIKSCVWVLKKLTDMMG